MVLISEPDPFVLCPQCIRVNYLKHVDASSLCPSPPKLSRVGCFNCGFTRDYGEDEILPIDRSERGWGRNYAIYMLTNIKNDMIYIGRTTSGLHVRMMHYWSYWNKWKEWQDKPHRPSAYSMRIVKAMVEDGFESFQMILLEKGDGKGVNAERRWLLSFDLSRMYNSRFE